jgi:CBS-domain-containing membrane protein
LCWFCCVNKTCKTTLVMPARYKVATARASCGHTQMPHGKNKRAPAGRAVLFEKHDFNAFPVVEDGMLFGIISKFDFLRAFAFTTSQVVPHYNELMSRPAAEVMTEAVVHVHATSPLTRVLQ